MIYTKCYKYFFVFLQCSQTCKSPEQIRYPQCFSGEKVVSEDNCLDAKPAPEKRPCKLPAKCTYRWRKGTWSQVRYDVFSNSTYTALTIPLLSFCVFLCLLYYVFYYSFNEHNYLKFSCFIKVKKERGI